MYNTIFSSLMFLLTIAFPYVFLALAVVLIFWVLKINKKTALWIINAGDISYAKYIRKTNSGSIIRGGIIILIAIISVFSFKYNASNKPDFCYENWLCGVEIAPMVLIGGLTFISIIVKFIVTSIRFYTRQKKLHSPNLT